MATPPHAVCLPFPAQGHITPMLDVAKLLHARGFHVTFVNTEYNHARLVRARGAAAVAGAPGFRFAAIPDGLPPPPDGDGDVTQDIASLFRATAATCLGPFRRLLAGLVNGDGDAAAGRPPATCVVSDVVMGFSVDAAAELGLPCVMLWTASATRLLCYRLLDTAPAAAAAAAADDVLGSMRLPIRSLIRTTMGSPDEYMTRFVIRETARAAASAAALIVNTFDELEGEAVAAMAALGLAPKAYALGPLPLVAAAARGDQEEEGDPPEPAPGPPRPGISLSLWKEEREEAIAWLAGREPGSVVYVNFGSIAVATGEQLAELAWGLAGSGRPFLWVVRPDLAAALPPGFLAGGGLVVGWCPQREVLAHPAVGAFLTHSGWNSAVEAVCAGVPVLSWPFFADQRSNCWCQCNDWGVGVQVDAGGVVRRDAVARLVAEVVDGERGKEMRRRAQEWRDKAIQAAKPGGPSQRNLDHLLRNVLLPNN